MRRLLRHITCNGNFHLNIIRQRGYEIDGAFKCTGSVAGFEFHGHELDGLFAFGIVKLKRLSSQSIFLMLNGVLACRTKRLLAEAPTFMVPSSTDVGATLSGGITAARIGSVTVLCSVSLVTI